MNSSKYEINDILKSTGCVSIDECYDIVFRNFDNRDIVKYGNTKLTQLYNRLQECGLCLSNSQD